MPPIKGFNPPPLMLRGAHKRAVSPRAFKFVPARVYNIPIKIIVLPFPPPFRGLSNNGKLSFTQPLTLSVFRICAWTRLNKR